MTGLHIRRGSNIVGWTLWRAKRDPPQTRQKLKNVARDDGR